MPESIVPQRFGKREGWEPPENDHTAVGSRSQFAARVRELVAIAGEQATEELSQPNNVKRWVKSLMEGVDVRDRTCMNLYPKVMKMVEQEQRITIEFINSLGAKSAEELRGYVEAAKSVEGAGPHDGASRCTDYLEAYLNLYPEQRGTIVKRLGGLVAAG